MDIRFLAHFKAPWVWNLFPNRGRKVVWIQSLHYIIRSTSIMSVKGELQLWTYIPCKNWYLIDAQFSGISQILAGRLVHSTYPWQLRPLMTNLNKSTPITWTSTHIRTRIYTQHPHLRLWLPDGARRIAWCPACRTGLGAHATVWICRPHAIFEV